MIPFFHFLAFVNMAMEGPLLTGYISRTENQGVAMLTKEAFAFYEAGAAVAAVYLRLKLRRVSINAARGSSEVEFPREAAKPRIIVWLAGLAAEKKGVGKTDTFRRMKNRERIRAELAQFKDAASGPPARREEARHTLLNQAQDRANAICNRFFPAIQQVARQLLAVEILNADEVQTILTDFRRQQKEAAASARSDAAVLPAIERADES